MTPERYQRLKEILHTALDLAAADRPAFLDRACVGDEELRREAESLILADSENGDFLETPVSSGALQAGVKFGQYEILGPLGAGAMGEVYQAYDSRFDRPVAVKILPRDLAAEPERFRRFEREARAVGSLNHPNILVVHDFGAQDGIPYLVSELLEGTTLRERLTQSRIPPVKAIGYACQIARGLGAAHSKGIVHRDVKPENIFITRDGVVKILDFGIAKVAAEPAGDALTQAGMLMGTVEYMSPEQVRCEAADQHSDIFNLGVVLHEMLAGKRPFGGTAPVEVMNAILNESPPDLEPDPAGSYDKENLRRIVEHCLEKQPGDRFESARDLGFALESLVSQRGRKEPSPHSWRRPAVAISAAAVLLAASLLAVRPTNPSLPAYQRLTFRRGSISAARFTADGNTIVYSAAWDGAPFHLYTTRSEGPDSRPIDNDAALLLSVSSRGEMALCLPSGILSQHGFSGALATELVGGGGRREITGDISSADWSPDGLRLAVARVRGGRYQLEYPVGTVLYRAPGYIEDVRVSPRGDRIAFLEHPLQSDTAGFVSVVDTAGRYKVLSRRFNSSRGLAWPAAGDEIWFSAAEKGTNLILSAVSLAGKERVIARFPVYMNIEDISGTGRVLLSSHAISQSMVHVGRAGQADMYWHDQSEVRDLSSDGARILFAESGEPSGTDYDAYLRQTDGSPAVLLGSGLPVSLSSDGQSTIANPAGTPAQLTLLSNGSADARPLTTDQINHVGAAWLPDQSGFVFVGSEPEGRLRYFVQPLRGAARPITDDDIRFDRLSPIVVSPDGRFIAAVETGGRVQVYPVAGGVPRPLPGLESSYTPLRWCPGNELILHRYDLPLPQLWKASIDTGKPRVWKELTPPNPVGLIRLTPIRVSADCSSFAYSPLNVFSSTYLVDGLR